VPMGTDSQVPLAHRARTPPSAGCCLG
jgi:hypothetical protein